MKNIWAAADVLEDMALRGEDVTPEEIMIALQVAIIQASNPDKENEI